MADEQARQLLQQGIAAAQANQSEAARGLLQRAIQLDPQNETAWLWLSSVARDNKERLFCLRQLLAINPHNEYAIKGLRALGVELPPSVSPDEPGEAGSVPVLSEEKYTRLQPDLEDVLRRYASDVSDVSTIKWIQKRRRRYGESGAERLRSVVVATAAIVLVGAVIGLIVLLAHLGILGGDEETAVVAQATRVPSATPTLTLTPTPGGATPTSMPLAVAAILTYTPAGMPRGATPGSIFEHRPTEIYPRVDAGVANSILGAVDYFSVGDYDQAIGTLAAEHELSGGHCYPSVVYYEALSYAKKDTPADLSVAERLLQDALAYQPPGARYSTCQDSPLIFAGLAYVQYAKGNLNGALSWCTRALEADPKLAVASITKAKIELAREQIPAARATIATALNESPTDSNLLTMAAEIELASGQANSALDYLRRTLYVEPASQEALRLQARAYLMLAGQLPDTVESAEIRQSAYGLGVISAQSLLLVYPGDPMGYVLLAQARMGEGNYQLAETALNRVLNPQANVQASAPEIIGEARRVRGELYYQQRRLQQAREDLAAFVASGQSAGPTDYSKLAEIDFQLGEYGTGLNWLEQLLMSDPTNSAYQLLRIKALVELCTFFPDELSCDYRAMLNELDEAMIMSLPTDAQRADAYSYRGQARYWLTLRNRSLDEDERDLALRLSLNDIDQALAIRDGAVDHYYRGLLLQELNEFILAQNEFEWVSMWHARYAYPFVDEVFERQMTAVAEKVLEQVEADEALIETAAPAEPGTMTATVTTVIETPEMLATATPSPSPTATVAVTPTPAPGLAPQVP